MASTLRLLAAAFVLFALLVPQAEVQAADIRVEAPVSIEGGGSCGEDEEVATVACGANIERAFDEPLAMMLLRQAGIELSREQCRDLLGDIWADQSCEGRGPNCGEMNSAIPPAPGPKLASGSSSARSVWTGVELGGAGLRGQLARAARPLGSRDLQPPVPPPRRQAQ